MGRRSLRLRGSGQRISQRDMLHAFCDVCTAKCKCIECLSDSLFFPPLVARFKRSATSSDVSSKQVSRLKLALENLREEPTVRKLLFFAIRETDEPLEKESSKTITDEDIDDIIAFSSVIPRIVEEMDRKRTHATVHCDVESVSSPRPHSVVRQARL